VLGIISYEQLTPTLSSPSARETARRFAHLLELREFHAEVHDYPLESVVDFYDPKIRELVLKIAAPYDREKAERFVLWSAGSMRFYDRTFEGDVPVMTVRPPEARGSWKETLEIPPEFKVKEVHWHLVDTLPTTHLHITGETVDLLKLAAFLVHARDVTRKMARAVGITI